MASIPAVKELESRHHARGLRAISVTKHASEEAKWVQDSVKKHGMKYPCFLDSDGSWSSSAGARLIPLFLLVDRTGRLAYRHSGVLEAGTKAFAAFEAAVGKALDG